MNLTITPISFKSHNYNNLSLSKNNRDNFFRFDEGLLDEKCAKALKNQVLFKGKLAEDRVKIEDTLFKYNLKLFPETFEYIIKNRNIADSELARYAKKGREVFVLYLRGELNKVFPYKDVGELNDLTLKMNKPQNIARITKELFDKKLFPYSTEEPESRNLSRKFYAILGAITIEGEEEGYQNALDFLNENVSSVLIPSDNKIQKNFREKFYDDMTKRGYEPKDFFISTKLKKSGFCCSIFYKNNLLTTAIVDTTKKRAVIEAAMNDVISKIDSNELCLDEMNWTDKKIVDYAKADSERVEKLEKFCQKYNLNFSDINLLNRVFLVANMPDGTLISTYESYEPLEFIGDGVLEFCTHEYLYKNIPQDKKGVIGKKLHTFVSNENLAKLSLEMGLDKLLLTKMPLKDKRHADLFEALIGAIYLNDSQNGLDNVYKFLEENFGDIICSTGYDD